MRFDIGILAQYWPILLQGAWLTVRICLTAFVVGYALGILVALLSLVPSRIVQALVAVYLAVLRAIPFIIILFLVYYGLPFAGVRFPAVVTGTVALSLFASAYYAEIGRAAIVALPRGQFESARVVGMSPLQAMRHIVFPQILRGLVPPSVNMTLTMVKESSVLSSITVAELTYQSLVVQGNTFAPFEAFAAVTLIYWAIAILVARAAALFEARTGVAERQDVERSALAASFLSLDRRPAR
ncbi:amino acid ABC transporter permease [Labrys wisconsinensis]|uniref:Polar amino acid transport system permease protein n=1 Tax=Labrys wisconsinensis TaxID=425677 RepID=A0ABU0J576_9HYPH|nr:amino acid ABC transporter permease [Labrys wisconsinensis]MDQ0469413.1 polar amino acid transport system permease protein [Labrys wisconsinensis]